MARVLVESPTEFFSSMISSLLPPLHGRYFRERVSESTADTFRMSRKLRTTLENRFNRPRTVGRASRLAESSWDSMQEPCRIETFAAIVGASLKIFGEDLLIAPENLNGDT